MLGLRQHICLPFAEHCWLQFMSSLSRSIWGRLLKIDSWVPSLFLTSASQVIGRLEADLSDQVADDGGDGVEYEHGQDAEDHCVLMIVNMIECSSSHKPILTLMTGDSCKLAMS